LSYGAGLEKGITFLGEQVRAPRESSASGESSDHPITIRAFRACAEPKGAAERLRGRADQGVCPYVNGADLLEGQASCEDRVVVGGVEAGDCDLIASSKAQAHSPGEMQASDYEARGREGLLLAVVFSVLEER